MPSKAPSSLHKTPTLLATSGSQTQLPIISLHHGSLLTHPCSTVVCPCLSPQSSPSPVSSDSFPSNLPQASPASRHRSRNHEDLQEKQSLCMRIHQLAGLSSPSTFSSNASTIFTPASSNSNTNPGSYSEKKATTLTLKNKNIIHVSTPAFDTTPLPLLKQLLANAYRDVLITGIRNGVRSVAFPVGGMGVGWPERLRARLATITIRDMLRHPIFGAERRAAFDKIIFLVSGDDDVADADAHEAGSGLASSRFRLGFLGFSLSFSMMWYETEKLIAHSGVGIGSGGDGQGGSANVKAMIVAFGLAFPAPIPQSAPLSPISSHLCSPPYTPRLADMHLPRIIVTPPRRSLATYPVLSNGESHQQPLRRSLSQIGDLDTGASRVFSSLQASDSGDSGEDMPNVLVIERDLSEDETPESVVGIGMEISESPPVSPMNITRAETMDWEAEEEKLVDLNNEHDNEHNDVPEDQKDDADRDVDTEEKSSERKRVVNTGKQSRETRKQKKQRMRKQGLRLAELMRKRRIARGGEGAGG